jgi:hypothetical protein
MQERRRYLIPWGALGAVEAFIFGIPFAIFGMSELLDANDFFIAKTCFLVGCLLLGIQAILLAARRRGLMSYLLVFALCGAIGVVGLFLFNYVDRKRDAKVAKEALTTQTPSTTTPPTSSPSQTPTPAATPSPTPTARPSASASKSRPKRSKVDDLQRRKEEALRILHSKDQ